RVQLAATREIEAHLVAERLPKFGGVFELLQLSKNRPLVPWRKRGKVAIRHRKQLHRVFLSRHRSPGIGGSQSRLNLAFRSSNVTRVPSSVCRASTTAKMSSINSLFSLNLRILSYSETAKITATGPLCRMRTTLGMSPLSSHRMRFGSSSLASVIPRNSDA